MPNFKEKLELLKSTGLYRDPVCVESQQGTEVVIGGRKCVCFCSNNYLNLAADRRVIEAVCREVRLWGHGAAASRLISGTMRPHIELEHKLAALFGKPAALVFPSGWMANEAVIRTLASREDLVLLDRLDHASIIDAARSCGARLRTYRRADLGRAEKLLQGPYRRRFIITESIFSMDGDTADLEALVRLKETYDAMLIVDEAHALGCMGSNGAGLAEQLGLLGKVDIIVATLSKVLGSAGGVVAGAADMISCLVNGARGFIYTTAPSVANCAAALAALEIVKSEPGLRNHLAANAARLRGGLAAAGADIGASTTHIVPVILGDTKAAVDISAALMKKGYFVPAIRPPTVPVGTSRLRISVQAGHSRDQIEGLCTAIAACLGAIQR